MILRATHSTTYSYADTVSICYTEARLLPRTTHGQTPIEHELVIDPEPDSTLLRTDFFGNSVAAFSVQQPHHVLKITSRSIVETRDIEQIHPGLTPPWEQVKAAVERHDTEDTFEAFQFIFESPRVACLPEFAEYGRPSFAAGVPLLEGALDLCRRIHADFKYNTAATTVSTPVGDALRERHGVCQDFAHVMIACLRSIGLPARYVSGYLMTGEDAVGAGASHAWVSVYCPRFGWLDLDPTNNVMPSSKHITLGWGRDYSDVPPVKGVALGGGEQTITVEVMVTPTLSETTT
ncbi:MAG TPA: transglutaminase family protein [Candidatus Binataceae bacterium]|nr:transglutaminase family protein [Candidatus Binataceae bacterium]